MFVLGGMYAGVFTATEAAAAGAWLALFVGVVIYRQIGWRAIWESAIDACRVSAMLFMILAGASVFGHVMTKLRIPQQIVEAVIAADIGVTGFLIVMMALIFVLGMFLESIAIILITTPVILPAMIHLQINPIWYGILLVINLELAQITPPVGMNLFTIKAITKSPLGADRARRRALCGADDRRAGRGDGVAADRAVAAGHDAGALSPADHCTVVSAVISSA